LDETPEGDPSKLRCANLLAFGEQVRPRARKHGVADGWRGTAIVFYKLGFGA